jgi:hypothetical protein
MGKNELVITYLAMNFPKDNILSVSRLCKMVYLADWRASIYYRSQLTSFEWKINYSGPYSEDLEDTLYNNNDIFKISKSIIAGCGNIKIVECKRIPIISKLLPDDKDILDKVLSATCQLDWDSFIEIVYSTYPIAMKDRYVKMDLPKLAQEYKYIKRSIEFA